jgi:acetoin utilization deacetylase AcuC-like enzyme
MTETGYVFHASYLLHDTGAGHPESAARLDAVMAHLRSTGLLDRLVKVDARLATAAEISLVHGVEYQSRLAAICRSGGGNLDGDTPVSPGSCNASEYAVGGAVAAVEAVMDGKVSDCFALVRPPGHHAFPGYGSGFCLYNNVAVAARYARKKYGLKKIVIIDFDVHHGNGTQAIFDGDADMLYVSTHEYPHYPGSGSVEVIGRAGTAVNIPLPAGCGDTEYLRVFDEVIFPAVRRFKPELVLVSAGYDGHLDDPLAGMRLSTGGYAAITGRIKSLVEECCGGKVVFCLEGGYNLRALAESVAATFSVLLSDKVGEESLPGIGGISYGGLDITELIANLKGIHHL